VLYWVLKLVVLGPWLQTLFRPWVEGEENIPVDGPAILVSNHVSFSDSIFLPLVLQRRATFLAKSDYFTGSGPKGLLMKVFFGGTGQVPIDRSGGKASEAALTTGLRVLSQGDLLALYPEGTRSPDGQLYRGKTGAARMALESGVPVIPVAMIGTREIQPPHVIKPTLRRVGIRVGKPLDFSRYAGMGNDRFVLRSVTDEMMYELMQLSGQRYVDMYAGRAKDLLAEGVDPTSAQLADEVQGMPVRSGSDRD
jgi:1-acyl-sn-glycerol-3-phosphate acyltransferase